MKYIGIVGHGENKFTERSKLKAHALICLILRGKLKSMFPHDKLTVVSGHSPVGGIDIWAEEVAKEINLPLDLKIPKQHCWNAEYGYKQRNIDIAKYSDEVHVIVVDKYPPNYKGMTFANCYHCNSSDHIKSGGCWTGKQAIKLGKKVVWHVIRNENEE